MTTTTKKIELRDRDKQLIEKMQKVLQAALGGEVIQRRSWNGEDNWTQANCVAWNFTKYDYRIKPADPKPLECWAAVGEDGGIIGASRSWQGVGLKCCAVHMREVTPQDEQDRKDAARYRRAKKWLRNSNYLHDIALGKWDEMIDKAIKDQ